MDGPSAEFKVGDSIVVCCHPAGGFSTHGAAWRSWPRGNTGPLRIVEGAREQPIQSGLTITLIQVEELLRASQNPDRGISVVRAGQEKSVGESSAEKSKLFSLERDVRDMGVELEKVKLDLRKAMADKQSVEERLRELEAMNEEYATENERLTKQVAALQTGKKDEKKGEEKSGELPLETAASSKSDKKKG